MNWSTPRCRQVAIAEIVARSSNPEATASKSAIQLLGYMESAQICPHQHPHMGGPGLVVQAVLDALLPAATYVTYSMSCTMLPRRCNNLIIPWFVRMISAAIQPYNVYR